MLDDTVYMLGQYCCTQLLCTVVRLLYITIVESNHKYAHQTSSYMQSLW